MEEEQPNDEITDHPRDAEIREVFRRLSYAYDAAPHEEIGPLKIVDANFPVGINVYGGTRCPSFCADNYTYDEIAFALAYGIAMNPVTAFLEESKMKSVMDKFDDDSWALLALSPFIGVSAGFLGIWRYTTRFAEREREAIEEVVHWVEKAGFDSNAGVEMFIKSEGWLDTLIAEQKEKPKPKATWSSYVRAAIMAPIGGAMAAAMKDDMPLVNAQERAAAVRAACVKAGFAD